MHVAKWALVLGLMAASCAGTADGMLVADAKAVRASVEKALIKEPEQKAAIFFSNGVEKLIISPSYEGAPQRFAWVVPVPSRPKVEIVQGAIFHELANIIIPLSQSRMAGAIGSAKSKDEAPVKVLERKLVGKYDVTVLSATDGTALMKWMETNKYYLPQKALGPIRTYVNNRWTFVACRISDSARGTAQGLAEGTLAPLMLTFRSKKPVYPLRLSSVNPEPFDLLVYIILPVPVSGRHLVKPRQSPKGTYTPFSPCDGWCISALEQHLRPRCPALSKLCRQTMEIFEAATTDGTGKIRPETCKTDLVWDISVVSLLQVPSIVP